MCVRVPQLASNRKADWQARERFRQMLVKAEEKASILRTALDEIEPDANSESRVKLSVCFEFDAWYRCVTSVHCVCVSAS